MSTQLEQVYAMELESARGKLEWLLKLITEMPHPMFATGDQVNTLRSINANLNAALYVTVPIHAQIDKEHRDLPK